MQDGSGNDPLGILAPPQSKPSQNGNGDPLGILKKKEPTPASQPFVSDSFFPKPGEGGQSVSPTEPGQFVKAPPPIHPRDEAAIIEKNGVPVSRYPVSDWKELEQSIIEKNKATDKYRELSDFQKELKHSAGDWRRAEQMDKEVGKAQVDAMKSDMQYKFVAQKYQDQLSNTINGLINSGEYKKYFDEVGNFKSDKAIDFFDKLTKQNGAGNFTRDQLVAKLKQEGQYKIEEPERNRYREEEFKKQGIDISKYGKDLFTKLAAKPLNNLDLLKQETDNQASKLLENIKPLAVKAGADYTTKLNELKAQVESGQLPKEEADKQLQQLNQQYQQQLDHLDKQYQDGVRSINLQAQDKYAKINTEIQNIGKSITDEQYWQSIPKEERDKIQNANKIAEEKFQKGKEAIRKGVDVAYDVHGIIPYGGLFGKSIVSGWYQGLSNLGDYLSQKGYNNAFGRYLQGKQYDADVAAPAQYQWNESPVKRAISGTGQSLGASAPILIPSAAIAVGTGGLGLPEIVGTIATGLTSYYGEKAQNTGDVYRQLLEKTGDPTKAYSGAQEFERQQAITLPLYFLEGAGIQNILKGGTLKKLAIGQAQELSQELPTEYWQNYTQAQKVEGYDKSFGSYIRDNPETALDVIVATIGQSGTLSAGGKIFNSINSLIPQSKVQFYSDMIGKYGIDFAQENLKQQYNAGVIDEKQFETEQGKIMIAAKKLKDFEGLGLKGEEAKTYFTLSEAANQYKNAIENTQDEGLKIAYEQKLDETKKQLEDLTKGKSAYAVITMPGGANQTKVVPISDIQQLEKSGKLNDLIHQADAINVVGDEKLNKELNERKQELGNPAAPDGFYTNDQSINSQNTQQNAETIRGNQGQVPEGGQIREGGENTRSQNLQQPAERAPINAETAQQAGEKIKKTPIEKVEDFEAELKALQDNSFDRISEEVNNKAADNSIDEYLTKSKAVLNNLFPGIEVSAYDTEAEYREKEGRPVGSMGVFHGDENRIAYNLERIKKADSPHTIFHEIIHPIVNEAIGNKSGVLSDLYSALESIKDEPGMKEVWDHVRQYAPRGGVVQMVEGVTEFLALAADGKIDTSKLSERALTKVIDVINRILKAIGINKQLSTADDLKRLSDSIKIALQGNDISKLSQTLGKRTEVGISEKLDSLKESGKEIKDGDTVKGVLEKLKGINTSDGELAAELIKKADEESLNAKIVVTPESSENRAYYDAATDTIHFEGNSGDNVQTVLHEVIHAMTSQKLPYEVTTYASNKGADYLYTIKDSFHAGKDKNIRQLIGLYEEAVRGMGVEDLYFGKNGIANDYDAFNKSKNENKVYGLVSLDEFLSESFTNPLFQEQLKAIESNGITAWDKFVNFIKNLFGIKKSNVLSDVLSVGNKIIASPREFGSHRTDKVFNSGNDKRMQRTRELIERSKNVPEEQLKKSLRSAGFSESEITELFNKKTDAKNIFKELDKADSKKSEFGKNNSREKLRKEYGSTANTAIFIKDNFDEIVKQLEQNKKIEKVCP